MLSTKASRVVISLRHTTVSTQFGSMSSPASEYDYIIIGSGFGGSVSAMRLTQKGYRVAVIESGKRFAAEDFAKTNWNLRRFFWMPRIFCYGIMRINLLRHVMIVSGAGVGGGSLVYANTLYIPKDAFFENSMVKRLGGKKAFLPFYQLAQKMLGVTQNPHLWEVDHHMKETAREFGKEDTFVPTPVGVFFDDEGKKQGDPYFSGEGPDREGCIYCGACMVGCRHNAKNTLDKNYLYFAEKNGAEVIPESKVVDVIPLSEDGSEGYEVRTISTTGLFGSPRRSYRAQNVIFSAGVLGTINLLLKLKSKGRLPRLSDHLGQMTRTNSEALIGVTSKDHNRDFSKGLAITSSIHPDEHTHIEPVRYPSGSDVMLGLATTLTDGGGRIPRQLRFLWNILRAPIDFLRTLLPFGAAKRSIILLVMQTLDNSIRLVRKRRLVWPFQKTLTSELGQGQSIPTYIPLANEFARRLAKRINGIAQSSINEVLLDVPSTAHILGGAIIGNSPEDGVIDSQNRVFGYQNMLVCDGSMIPGNLGVNPSLSITAFTERAMSFIPPKRGAQEFFKFEKRWKVTGMLEPKRKAGGVARKRTAKK